MQPIHTGPKDLLDAGPLGATRAKLGRRRICRGAAADTTNVQQRIVLAGARRIHGVAYESGGRVGVSVSASVGASQARVKEPRTCLINGRHPGSRRGEAN